MAEVDIHVEIPAFGRHGHCVAPCKRTGCGRIVDENMNCCVGLEDLLGEGLQFGKVCYVALVEDWGRDWGVGYWVF